MTPALRTKILGALAAAAVLYAVVSSVQEPGRSTSSSGRADAAPATSAVVVLAGAPRDLDRQGLAERYRPIRTADPFKPRSFEPPRPPRTPPPPRPTEPSPGERRPLSRRDPENVDLRLTGLLGHGEARLAVLEDGSGKGLFAIAGASLGPVSVAAVGTDSVTFSFEEGGRTRSVELGDMIQLPKAVESKLEPLKATGGDVAAVSTGAAAASGSAAPAMSDEDRQAVLERLRERRRRQVQGGGE